MYDKKKKGMYKKLFHSIEKSSQLNSFEELLSRN